jgi:hypothetical protein
MMGTSRETVKIFFRDLKNSGSRIASCYCRKRKSCSFSHGHGSLKDIETRGRRCPYSSCEFISVCVCGSQAVPLDLLANLFSERETVLWSCPGRLQPSNSFCLHQGLMSTAVRNGPFACELKFKESPPSQCANHNMPRQLSTYSRPPTRTKPAQTVLAAL